MKQTAYAVLKVVTNPNQYDADQFTIYGIFTCPRELKTTPLWKTKT